MGIPKTIKLHEGTNGNIEYYYWSEYESWKEAVYYAKQLKQTKRNEGIKIQYFILESEDSWFLPVSRFVLYINRRLKII